jgi:hypothetical protein
MAPIANDPELSSQSTAGAGAKPQPAAVEIPVTVNGARTIEGSAKREPFSETTQTVLVFGNGAVIRLNSPVAPGQLLFLTNEKSKKEVVCQVVKSKTIAASADTSNWNSRKPHRDFGACALLRQRLQQIRPMLLSLSRFRRSRPNPWKKNWLK